MKIDFAFAGAILEIVWINLLLSGDNAILIALACRELPEKQRRWGIFLGALGGLILRIVFTLVFVEILSAPLLKTVGGLLLIVIAIKMATDRADHSQVDANQNFWNAVFSIIVADATMSLDNVVAIAAAAEGSLKLVIFGLTLSAPILMFGAGAILRVLDRFPILVWAGAGLLGWIAGDLIAGDPLWRRFERFHPPVPEIWLCLAGASIVIALAFIVSQVERWKER